VSRVVQSIATRRVVLGVPGRRLGARRWLLALGTVALAGVVAAAQPTTAAAVLRGLMIVVLVPCAAIDIERRIIPNRITGPGALLALGVGLAVDLHGEPSRVLWATVTAGFLLLASLARPSGMGMGDVKLLGVMGLFLGRAVIVALFAALLLSVLTGAAIATRRGVHRARKTALPFGPYLAAGGVIAALAGDPIIHAFLHLHR
jgi:leader peptidase (prepilin peptidase) / N-methyltransferase